MDLVELVKTDFALGLGFTDHKRGKPYFCDFTTRAWRLLVQNGLAKSHIFRRALGIKNPGLKVFDATAGFGRDSLMALCAGCEVTAVERSPLVYAVLRDGLERAAREEEHWAIALKHFHLIESEAQTYLNNHKPSIDVVYIDPMFDKPKRTAKSPKEMQLLQELLPPPNPEQDLVLFETARRKAISRVVVKRPLKARAVASHPTHAYKGQSIRYDVYVRV